jgi:hypothetical protein
MSTSETIGTIREVASAVPAHDSHLRYHRGLSNRRAVIELAILVFLIEAIMWIVPLAPYSRITYGVIALIIVLLLGYCYIRDGVSARELGLRFDNLLRVLKSLSIPLALFILPVLFIGFEFGAPKFGKKFWSMLLFVPAWALLQQYMLLAFVDRRLRLIFGDGAPGIVATSALFSLLHLPNPVLMVACAAGGYLWTRQYRNEPNLFSNALTHAVASAFLANALPGSMLKNMVVGYNYFLR